MGAAMPPLHHTSLCSDACLRRGTYYIYVCVASELVAVTIHQPHFCNPTAGRLPLMPLLYANHAMCPSRSLHAKDTLARKVCHGCCLHFCLDFVLFFPFLLVIDKDFLSNPPRRWDFKPNYCERTKAVHLQHS